MSKPVQPIRPAATIILARDSAPQGLELFMLRRTQGSAFAGGMYVFPGGRVEGDDHLHAYDPYRTGPSEAQQPQLDAIGHEWRGFWIAAIRETFEEAGVLLAYNDLGQLVTLEGERRERFEAYRHAIHDGTLDLETLCQQEGLTLACDRVHFYNRWVTPLGRPRRFDTRFFIAEAPPQQVGLHDDKELDDSCWITPEQALERHRAGDFDLMAVTVKQLEGLCRFDSIDALHRWALSPRPMPTIRPVLPPGA